MDSTCTRIALTPQSLHRVQFPTLINFGMEKLKRDGRRSSVLFFSLQVLAGDGHPQVSRELIVRVGVRALLTRIYALNIVFLVSQPGCTHSEIGEGGGSRFALLCVAACLPGVYVMDS